ncbi:MAG: DUF3099 domain-containing protein [Dermatophilus congolensis]|nr:DUF3099 domain-containing protein [Dermatophilus congolensis]
MPASEWDERVVHSISTAPVSAAEDQRHRVRAYLISMSIRTGSFALAGLFGFVLDVPWAAWGFMIAAVVLPYPAVVLANNRDRHVTAPTIISPIRGIESGAHESSTWDDPDDDAHPFDRFTDPEEAAAYAAARDRRSQEIARIVDERERTPGAETQRPMRRNWMSG